MSAVAALEVLGLPPGSGVEAAKAAFRRLALRYHPDKNAAPDAADKFRDISSAFETIVRDRGETRTPAFRPESRGSTDPTDPTAADATIEGWAFAPI